MAYPNPPEIQTSYTAQEQALGDGTLPGQELDVDLAAIRASVTAIIEFLKLTLRSDGKLNNGTVTKDSLSSNLIIGLDTPTPWATATDYTATSLVFSGFGLYLCLVPHTSSDFATDLASGRWQLVLDLTPPGGALIASNNLSDLADAGNARSSLGLGTIATVNAGTGASDVRTNSQNDTVYQAILTGLTASPAELNALDGITATVTELNYTDGVTAPIQTQLDGKSPAAALHTIWLPAGSFTPTTTNGAIYASQELATNDVMVSGFDFSASVDQKVQTMIAMPKSWNEGTFTVEVVWKDGTTAGSGDVVWGVRALAVSNDDALDAAFGTAVTVTDTFITAGDLHISPVTGAVTAAGTPANGDLLVLEVYRDADAGGDTYTQLARFMGVRLFYTTNAGDDT